MDADSSFGSATCLHREALLPVTKLLSVTTVSFQTPVRNPNRAWSFSDPRIHPWSASGHLLGAVVYGYINTIAVSPIK